MRSVQFDCAMCVHLKRVFDSNDDDDGYARVPKEIHQVNKHTNMSKLLNKEPFILQHRTPQHSLHFVEFNCVRL